MTVGLTFHKIYHVSVVSAKSTVRVHTAPVAVSDANKCVIHAKLHAACARVSKSPDLYCHELQEGGGGGGEVTPATMHGVREGLRQLCTEVCKCVCVCVCVCVCCAVIVHCAKR